MEIEVVTLMFTIFWGVIILQTTIIVRHEGQISKLNAQIRPLWKVIEECVPEFLHDGKFKELRKPLLKRKMKKAFKTMSKETLIQLILED